MSNDNGSMLNVARPFYVERKTDGKWKRVDKPDHDLRRALRTMTRSANIAHRANRIEDWRMVERRNGKVVRVHSVIVFTAPDVVPEPAPRCTPDEAMAESHARSISVGPDARARLGRLQRDRAEIETEWRSHPTRAKAMAVAAVYQALARTMDAIADA